MVIFVCGFLALASHRKSIFGSCVRRKGGDGLILDSRSSINISSSGRLMLMDLSYDFYSPKHTNGITLRLLISFSSPSKTTKSFSCTTRDRQWNQFLFCFYYCCIDVSTTDSEGWVFLFSTRNRPVISSYRLPYTLAGQRDLFVANWVPIKSLTSFSNWLRCLVLTHTKKCLQQQDELFWLEWEFVTVVSVRSLSVRH